MTGMHNSGSANMLNRHGNCKIRNTDNCFHGSNTEGKIKQTIPITNKQSIKK